MPGREVYALRYGSYPGTKASRYHRFASYDEPDGDAPLDFFFWLVRDGAHHVLVDCGFDEARARARGIAQDRHPCDLLAAVGVRAVDIDHVVLSHMHFDHIGNVGLFPNATFSVGRSEFDFWTGPLAERPHLSGSTERVEVEAVHRLVAEGRVAFVETALEVAPGVRAEVVGGHTPGQMIVTVDAGEQKVVLASDAAHLYDEFELDRPYWLFTNLPQMYTTYGRLRELASRSDTVVVPGHDPQVSRRFPCDGDITDLTPRSGPKPGAS